MCLSNSVAVTQFTLGGDFVLTYWPVGELNQQEDDGAYAQKRKERSKHAKGLMSSEPFAPTLVTTGATTSHRWNFARTLRREKGELAYQKDGRA